ncbi:MAG: hypothetical protein GY832_00460 [Chloroflexi bacterium]|nr:hypothetical protein [Chloroflexota bacterium]
MPTSDLEILKSTIQKNWSSKPSDKAKRYVGKFFDATRFGTKITAKVLGNHGTYTVSMQVKEGSLTSACSCYIGKYGGCHHCQSLAITFLQDTTKFRELKQRNLDQVGELADIPEYLRSVTLDELIQELKKKGITQKAFAESIGTSSQKLSAIKSSERRNRYFHELGATKLACLWVLERFTKKG